MLSALGAGLPVAPIRAIGWHARAPHIVASASALEDAQQAAVPVMAEGLEEVAEGLEGLGKSVAQDFEGLVNFASSPTEDLDRIMGEGTVRDLSNAFGLRTSMDGLRTNFDKIARSVFDLEEFPSLPPMVDPLEFLVWREQASSLMMSVRVAGVVLLLLTIVAAVAAGLIVGDRSAPPEKLGNGDEELFRKEMTAERAAQWDRQGWRSGLEAGVEEAAESQGAKSLSTGLWLELVVCGCLDVVGDASYFYPTFGEASDLVFAFVQSFSVEILFGWPALALFAFWEEALPVTDLIPSCTLAWMLVVTGGRSALSSPTPADEEGAILGSRRAFGDWWSGAPPEPHLVPDNTLWDDDGEEESREPGGVPASLFLRERRGARAFRDE